MLPLTRRNFLTTTSLAAAAALLPPVLRGQNNQPARKAAGLDPVVALASE